MTGIVYVPIPYIIISHDSLWMKKYDMPVSEIISFGIRTKVRFIDASRVTLKDCLRFAKERCPADAP
jgi:hypothetical protein